MALTLKKAYKKVEMKKHGGKVPKKEEKTEPKKEKKAEMKQAKKLVAASKVKPAVKKLVGAASRAGRRPTLSAIMKKRK
jgi:hypothetical protein